MPCVLGSAEGTTAPENHQMMQEGTQHHPL